jgi:predicted NAD/FAD-binding protein
MQRPKLAIVGTGISGLSAAYFLQRDFDLTVFEADDRIGGHTNTIHVDLATMTRVSRPSSGSVEAGSVSGANGLSGGIDGGVLPVDTGFIVFNDRTYPNLIRLFETLGVASKATEMSFSVRCDKTGIEYSGSTLDSYFAQRRNLLRPSFYRFLFDFRRFAGEAMVMLETDEESQTVGEFFRRRRYSDAFYRRYFLPMGSAIWSCPQGVFEAFPIRFICQFYHHHGLLTIRNRPQWRVVRGGSAQYLGRLTSGFADRIQCGSAVVSARRLEPAAAPVSGRWELVIQQVGVDGVRQDSVHRFDHVIFACHADQALKILRPTAGALESMLKSFPYQNNFATLHTDSSVLPVRRRAWAAWNYHLPRGAGNNPAEELAEQATVTYNMNRLQGYTDQQTRRNTFCVTLNGDPEIDSRKVIAKIPYAHPIFSLGRRAVQQGHDQWIDADGLSFCGAYWGNGFHEDGLSSALRVSTKLLGMDPWKAVCTVDGSNTVGSGR